MRGKVRWEEKGEGRLEVKGNRTRESRGERNKGWWGYKKGRKTWWSEGSKPVG